MSSSPPLSPTTVLTALRRGDPSSPGWAPGVCILVLVSLAVHLAMAAVLPLDGLAIAVGVAVAAAVTGALTVLAGRQGPSLLSRIVTARAGIAFTVYLLIVVGGSRGYAELPPEVGVWGAAAAVIDLVTGRIVVAGLVRELDGGPAREAVRHELR